MAHRNNPLTKSIALIVLLAVSLGVLARESAPESVARNFSSLMAQMKFKEACLSHVSSADLARLVSTLKQNQSSSLVGIKDTKKFAEQLNDKALNKKQRDVACEYYELVFKKVVTILPEFGFERPNSKANQVAIFGPIKSNDKQYFVARALRSGKSGARVRQLVVVGNENGAWKVDLNTRYKMALGIFRERAKEMAGRKRRVIEEEAIERRKVTKKERGEIIKF